MQITSRNASKAYLNMVDASYLGSSEEVRQIVHLWNELLWTLSTLVSEKYFSLQVTKLMERVEATFIKHFANGNHRKGMNTLRPKAKREKHRTTFSLGKIRTTFLVLVFRRRRIRDVNETELHTNLLIILLFIAPNSSLSDICLQVSSLAALSHLWLQSLCSYMQEMSSTVQEVQSIWKTYFHSTRKYSRSTFEILGCSMFFVV